MQAVSEKVTGGLYSKDSQRSTAIENLKLQLQLTTFISIMSNPLKFLFNFCANVFNQTKNLYHVLLGIYLFQRWIVNNRS